MYACVRVYICVSMCMQMSMCRFMCIGSVVYTIGAVEYTSIQLANPMIMVVFSNGHMGV